MTARTAKATSVFEDLPKQVEKVRAQAEKIAQRTLKQAFEMLPARSRKTLKDVTVRFEKATQDLQKRSERALKEVDARRKQIVSVFEQSAARAVKPLVARLDVATRTDVDRLSKRITQLERKVQQGAKRAVA